VGVLSHACRVFSPLILSVNEVVETLAHLCCRAVQPKARRCTVWARLSPAGHIIDDPKFQPETGPDSSLRPVYSTEGEPVNPTHVGHDVGVVEHCLATERPVNLHNLMRGRGDVASFGNFTTLLCVPWMSAEGRPIGVVQLLDKTDGTFLDADAQLISLLSLPAAGAILRNAQEGGRVSVPTPPSSSYEDHRFQLSPLPVGSGVPADAVTVVATSPDKGQTTDPPTPDTDREVVLIAATRLETGTGGGGPQSPLTAITVRRRVDSPRSTPGTPRR